MKIALCLSGQMRGFEQGLSWIKRLRTEHDVDVFVHTWSDRGLSTNLGRTLPKGMHRHTDLDHLFPDKALRLSELPELKKRLLPEQAITPTLLDAELHPVRAVIEDQPADFSITKTLYGVACPQEILDFSPRYYYSLAMFYKMHACQHLCEAFAEETGVRYDAIIRMRPDFVIKTFPDGALLQVSERPEAVFAGVMFNQDAQRTYISDQFAFGSPRAMAAYTGVWPKLTEYWDFSKDPEWKPQHRTIGLLVAEHLNRQNVAMVNIRGMQAHLASEMTPVRKAVTALRDCPGISAELSLTVRNDILLEDARRFKRMTKEAFAARHAYAFGSELSLSRLYFSSREDDPEAFDAAFRIAKKTAPCTPAPYFIAAEYYVSHGREADAPDLLHEAASLFSGDISTEAALVAYYQKTGKLQAAVYHCVKAAEVAPRDLDKVVFYRKIAALYVKLRQTKRAVMYCGKVFNILPGDPDAKSSFLVCKLLNKEDGPQDYEEIKVLHAAHPEITEKTYASYVKKYEPASVS